MNMHKGIAYFDTFEEARAVAAEKLKGYPSWRIIRYQLGWAIQYRVMGPYYPELEEKSEA